MINSESDGMPVDVGDVGELYGLLARRLEQIVRLDVRAPDVVIEDACQVAWSRLLRHRHRVNRETVLSWLVRTAVHEAFRLLGRHRRELSLEEAEETMPCAQATPAQMIECRERLAELDRLPERQQRAVWLHALGLNYAEIAVYEGCTTRTVERQLLRARQSIRHAEAA
ncbi:MAG TPA: sigma-70 family RNA polymerase sigma factor [Solirubrobacteraceae bacterium]|nr:sigma-70 family RNA polymerase sigma factor [Solirubrobacteraceae bacterium]